MSVHLVTDDQTLEREAEAGLEERERSGLLDRRSAWSDPRAITAVVQLLFSGCSVLVAIAGLAVVVLGGLVGAYVLNQTKTATSEMTNAQVAVEIGKVNTSLEKLDGKVTTAMGTLSTVQGRIDALQRETEQARATDRETQERLKTLERDYTSNLSTRLARVEAKTGIKSSGGD